MGSPRQAQVAIPRRGTAVLRLESPFPEYALPRVWTWIEEYRHRVTDDTAPKTLEAFVADFQGRRGCLSWGVWNGEDLGGLVVAEVSPVGVATCDALFKPTFRGRSTIRPALIAIVREIFRGGARKLIAQPFQGNYGMMALFRSLGAKREGVLRAQTLRQGKPIDVVILSLFREEFERWVGSQHSEESPASPAPPSPEAAASPSPPDSPGSAPSAGP